MSLSIDQLEMIRDYLHRELRRDVLWLCKDYTVSVVPTEKEIIAILKIRCMERVVGRRKIDANVDVVEIHEVEKKGKEYYVKTVIGNDLVADEWDYADYLLSNLKTGIEKLLGKVDLEKECGQYVWSNPEDVLTEDAGVGQELADKDGVSMESQASSIQGHDGSNGKIEKSNGKINGEKV